MGNSKFEEAPSFYAVIPANVRYDKKLPANAKLLYGEITALSNKKGFCWASNDYFADLYGVSKTSVSKWISSLVNNGYLRNELIYKNGTKEIAERRLWLAVAPIELNDNTYTTKVNDPIEEKLNTPIEEKLKDNNTITNNTSNNTSNKERKKGTTYDTIIAELVTDTELKETLYDFIKMRQMIKKPMTDRALKMLINKLETLSKSSNEQIAILDQSILNNWQDIYALKNEQTTQSKAPAKKDNSMDIIKELYLEAENEENETKGELW